MNVAKLIIGIVLALMGLGLTGITLHNVYSEHFGWQSDEVTMAFCSVGLLFMALISIGTRRKTTARSA